jgi:Flp pilus assembly pilin Flp
VRHNIKASLAGRLGASRGAAIIEYALLVAAFGLAAVLAAGALTDSTAARYSAACPDMGMADDEEACFAPEAGAVDPSPEPDASPTVEPSPWVDPEDSIPPGENHPKCKRNPISKWCKADYVP